MPLFGIDETRRKTLARMRDVVARMEAELDLPKWRVLAAMATNKSLGITLAERLGGKGSWLNAWESKGWIVESDPIRSLSFARTGPREAAFKLARPLDQLILRRSQQRGILGPLTLELDELFSGDCPSSLTRRLQAGSLVFRQDSVRALPRDLREALANSVLDAFDGEWFQATWGARAPVVAKHVLRHSLDELIDARPLFDWCCGHTAHDEDTELSRLLVCYALACQETQWANATSQLLPAESRWGFAAIVQLQEGKPALARRLLMQSLHASPERYPPLHPLSWVLGFLLESDREGMQEDIDAVRWLKRRCASEVNKAASKSLSIIRTLGDEETARQRRLDAYALVNKSAPAEFLLLALAVHAFVEPSATRSAWARLISEEAIQWIEAGFLWLGRQGLVVGAALDRDQVDCALSELSVRVPLSEAGLAISPGDLSALLRVREPWEVTLSALNRFTQSNSQKTRRRLAFFVELETGQVHQPGLEEAGEGRGWHLIRRLTFDEARALAEELPQSDRRVLDVERSISPEDPNRHLLLFEALIDHPRVVQGSAGDLAVEIRRGHFRIETEDTSDSLRIFVTPEGLGPGLNLVVEGKDRLSVVFVGKEASEVVRTLAAGLVLPRSETARALSVLSRLGEEFSVKSPHLSGETEVPADSTPVVRLSSLSGAWICEIGVRPFGEEGRFFALGSGPMMQAFYQAKKRVQKKRDHTSEERRQVELIEKLPILLKVPPDDTVASPMRRWVLGQDEVLFLMAELRESDRAHYLEWPEKNALRLGASLGIGSLRGALRAIKGWYLLSGSVALDQVTSINLQELSTMPFSEGRRFVRLPSGEYAAVDDKIRRLLSLMRGMGSSRGALKVSPARLLSIHEALEGATMDRDPKTSEYLDELADVSATTAEVPRTLRADLRTYQSEGFRWLCRLCKWGFGACLADDMGLGKTVQILAFLLTRPARSHMLVVAPTSVCTNWLRESERFAPSLRPQLFDSSAPSPTPGRLLILSYAQLKESVEQLSEIEWDTIVADEAQYIKNPKTQRARALHTLVAQHRIAATGTPVENHLGDLWGIFRFVDPQLLGGWAAFSTHFVKPIERDDDSLQKESLKRLVRPFILRRKKEEVLQQLPPRTTIAFEIRLSDEEAQRYALLRRQVSDKLRNVQNSANHQVEILAEITRLRRFCCHPRLVFPDAPDDSHKLRALIPLVEELVENGHRALVFSQYVDFLDKVRERLSERGIDHESLVGSTPRAERQRRVDRFQQGDVPLFLLSLKAGGVGLNLTAADYVIHLDPWWNPAVQAQATDRAHRIGQERPVTVYEFVTADTIEADIVRLHESKARLADALIQEAHEVGRLDEMSLFSWLSQSLAPAHHS